jgi:cystathionine beta-lyase/cystathionine gamma-synthase
VLDNTLAGPHNHGRFDVDVYVHSLTKFVAGHGDVMGGAVIARQELADRMRHDAITLGPTLDPHAAFLILRGLKTYFLRWDAHCANAQRVAEFLAGREEVSRVRYPGLPQDPGHALAARQMHGAGAVVSFDLATGLEAGTRFAEALELFSIASSLGSTESLVVPPALQQPRGLTQEQAAWSGIGAGTVRLSVGIEDADDLIADLRQALERSNG